MPSRFPKQLTSRRDEASVATAIAGEEKLFESRRSARTGQRSQLRERIAQINEEIRGLSAQHGGQGERDQVHRRRSWSASPSSTRRTSSPSSRFTQLQRDQARLQGERGQLIAEIARARGKISETELQIIQLDQDFRTEVLKDLREVAGQDRRAQGAASPRPRTSSSASISARRSPASSTSSRCTRSAA